MCIQYFIHSVNCTYTLFFRFIYFQIQFMRYYLYKSDVDASYEKYKYIYVYLNYSHSMDNSF